MSSSTIDRNSTIRPLVALAAIAVLAFCLREASGILTPILLGAFVAVATTPLLFFLYKKRVPKPIALSIAILVDLLALVSIAGLFAGSIPAITKRIPYYVTRVTEQLDGIIGFLQQRGFQAPGAELRNLINPELIFGLGTGFLRGLGATLSNIFVILLVSSFILAEAEDFGKKVRKITRQSEDVDRLTGGLRDINRYLEIKTLTSALTGIAATILCFIASVDFPFLWGGLVFFLNFIPNIGSILAAIPPIVLALIDEGLGTGIFVAGGFLAINFIIGNILEPRWMGRTLGLSDLLVLLSLFVWGWIFGPIGALLSAPLTMLVRLTIGWNPELRWLDILMGRVEDDEVVAAVSAPSGGSDSEAEISAGSNDESGEGDQTSPDAPDKDA